MNKRGLWLLFLALWMLRPAAAQEDGALAWATEAMQDERYERAEELLIRTARDDAGQAGEAYLLLAQLYTTSPLRDASKARRAIRKAVERDPDNLRYLEAQLQIWREVGSDPVALSTPTTREQRRADLARRMLAIDSTSAIAHEELGHYHMEAYENAYRAMSLPGISGGGASSLAEAFTYLDADVDEEDSTITFSVKGARISEDIEALKQDEKALNAYEEATAHLRRSIEAAPAQRDLYALLMEAYARAEQYDDALGVLGTMRVHFSETTDYWLYLGYVQFRRGDVDEAEQSFQQAFAYMPPAERSAFENIRYFLNILDQELFPSDSARFIQRYWGSRDPRYLTASNERRLEHYARLVYADLRFGQPEDGVRGWETEPGQVVLRYGRPLAEVTYASNANRYLLFHYGDFQFRFMDIAKAGGYVFFSPAAINFSGPVFRERENEHDYALRGYETIRETPERFEYHPPGRRREFPYLVNVFRGEEGTADVYVPMGIDVPADDERQRSAFNVETGVFLVSPDSGVVDDDVRGTSALSEGQMMTLGERTLWIDTRRLSLLPGEHEVSVEFEARGGEVVGFHRNTIEVPTYERGGFRLSDLMLAYAVEETTAEAEPGRVVRKGVSILPAPLGVFSAEQPMYLYFEMYHLALDAEGQAHYEVEAVLVPEEEGGFLRRLFGGGDEEGVSVQFERSSPNSEEGQYLILETQQQEPGTYELTLRVTDRVREQVVEAQRTIMLE